jgi:ClpP class serine protease
MKRARFMPAGPLAISADSWGIEFECVAGAPALFEAHGDFAVVDIGGPLTQRDALLWDSYESISKRVDAALASAHPTMLLRINSPGGMVAGCFELVDSIRARAAAAGKRVVAYVDGTAASAAYALACAAERIYVPSTGIVGSIGCLQVAVDQTAADRAMGLGFEIFASGDRKVDGNPHVAMNDGARTAIQSAVDEMAETFFALVASARGKSPAAIQALEAGCFVGARGVAAGLADEVKTFAEVTAGAQVTAQLGAEQERDMTEEEKAKAALKAIAEGDDEKAAKRAKAALAAFDDDGDDDKKKDDEATKAEGEEEDKKNDEKKDDDAEAKATAKAPSDVVMALAADVKEIKSAMAKKEEAAERASLLASRPDFPAEVLANMSTAQLVTVRDAVKTYPKFPKSNQVAAAIAGATGTVNATRGKGQRDAAASRLSPTEKAELDARMGLATKQPTIRVEGNAGIFNVMTSEDAARFLASKEGT